MLPCKSAYFRTSFVTVKKSRPPQIMSRKSGGCAAFCRCHYDDKFLAGKKSIGVAHFPKNLLFYRTRKRLKKCDRFSRPVQHCYISKSGGGLSSFSFFQNPCNNSKDTLLR
ncbi:hypothetical protein AVEN_180555-1 [Araneus ventricosus]|uniref:Uncharacterized protein n=1 Tax=Araneus ventricosus TaxID=182803 RepID=A0A4Y2FLB8_ARAVE|nr:hypothetical protein AVEN_180555-1 [Araneus ventricosus]